MSLNLSHTSSAPSSKDLPCPTYSPSVFKKAFTAGFLGNVLDHYDTALYGLLVPWLAPLIFPKEDAVVALVLAYGLLSAGMLTRPLGALFFGKYALKYGAQRGLVLSLAGVTLSTISMGCLPLYSHLGYKAIFFLVFLRAFQAFFAAGETALAPLFILQQDKPRRHTLTSACYEMSSIAGIILASSLVVRLAQKGCVEETWRYLFFLGAFTGLVPLYLRLKLRGAYEPTLAPKAKLYPILKQNKALGLQLFCLSSLSYLTYTVPFVLFNSFAPLVSGLSKAAVLQHHTLLLLFDLLFLPVLGYLAQFFDPKRFMLGSALLLGFSFMLVFACLPGISLGGLTVCRMAIICLGLAFMAPKRAWILARLKPEERYALDGFSYSLAAETIGRSSPAVCLYLWHKTGSLLAPGLYCASIGFAAALALACSKR